MSRLALTCALAATLLITGCGTSWLALGSNRTPAPPSLAGTDPRVVRASDIARVELPDLPPPARAAAAAGAAGAAGADARIHFGFDAVGIPPEAMALLAEQGRYLATHPGARLRIEGNTDERGSAEYNLALGEQRAQAVAQVLAAQGARAEQLEAVSWGREKPLVEGHDESAWAENRRADLVFSAR